MAGGPGSYVLGAEERKEVLDVLDGGNLFRYGTPGVDGFQAKVVTFENEMAERLGHKHVVTTSSGTGSLMCCLAALGIGMGDEVIVPSPYFPEYKVWIETMGCSIVEVPTQVPSFQLDVEAMGAAINEKTAAVIINSPNNPVGAVYTTNQTAGRGRLGRSWVNAEGRALYYTAVIREPLAQPATLPLLASLAVREQLARRYGVDCQIKWPNDLLLNGKKIVGILCESVSYGYQMQGRGIVCGIGINLAQPQSYFDAADLPNGTSLELQGAAVDLDADPQWLAEALTDFGFDRPLYTFAREGFAPFREYKAACINLGRHVTFDLPGGELGSGTAIDVDADGQLIVRTDSGEERVFTGEVSVHGIYGAV